MLVRLFRSVKWARALDGSEYMPGLVGLNNMKANDYVNVVMQICARITPLRCAAFAADASVEARLRPSWGTGHTVHVLQLKQLAVPLDPLHPDVLFLPQRDFFLNPDNYKSVRSPLVVRFGELVRKMWNTRNFKGQVSE